VRTRIVLLLRCWNRLDEQKSVFAQKWNKELKHKWDITKRCTRQPALTAERNAKFHSSRMAAGQFIAVSVTQNEDPHEDIKLIS